MKNRGDANRRRLKPWLLTLLPLLPVLLLLPLLLPKTRPAPVKRRPSPPAQRSRGIIQGATEAIISTDETRTILQANPSAAAMFGTTVEAMQGAKLDNYLPRDLRAFGGDDIVFDGGARLAGRRATDYAITGLRANGEQFALEGSLSSQIEDEQPIYTIILRDITERKQVQEQLEQSYSQLRQLSAALQTIREEERKHIARELHDDLGQLLATLRLDLTLLRQNITPTGEIRHSLQGMDQLIITAITSLRRIASNLRPQALDEGGLYFALQSLRQEFNERNSARFELLADEADLVLDDAASTAIFRIVQEALTNIARHAQARNITVALHRVDSALSIAIQDDGRGIEDADLQKASSFGLLGMRERVWGLHGDISIAGNGNGEPGTRIDIALPLPDKPA
jgi:PAS domain S-box-containing protein